MNQSPVEVVAAAIEDPQGRILLSKRAEHVHQGGLWEFPGGKREPGESADQALKREIREELGLEVLDYRPLICLTHHYPDKSVVLDVYKVTDYTGDARGLEGQPLQWVAPGELGQYPMPAADVPIVNALRLPEAYAITDSNVDNPEGVLAQLDQAIARRYPLVQLRVPGLPVDAYRSLAVQAIQRCRQSSTQLLLNAAPNLAVELNADGVHLSSERLLTYDARPVPSSMWLGVSCHNSLELIHAEQIGADFALLSPVLPTTSHPDAEPLGWERFASLVAEVALPVYALGGVGPEQVALAWTMGAQGVAGIGAFWPK